LATETSNDSPKMYGETEEPSASMVVPDDIFQVSTQDLAGYLSFRPKLLLQDPSDIMAVSKRRLNRWVRRMIHTVVNDRFVRPLAVAVTNLDSAYVATPKPFRVFGAGDMIDYGGVAFVRQDDPYRCNLSDPNL